MGPRHQHSSSESGRLSVPMWDSSDPNRNPLPLPLNPGLVAATRPNTSENIQNAANRIHERARESLANDYMSSISPSSSPERSLVKGAHRRLLPIESSNVKDLRSYLDGVRSGSPERPLTHNDITTSPYATPTRQGPKPILGENTPPSATVRALRSMPSRDEDSPLANITNATPTKTQNISMDNITSQLLKLTNIASSLQQEMSQLTRRSKDNAADLTSLKEATRTRDDEIRKDIRNLISTPTQSSSSPRVGLGLLDSRPHFNPTFIPRAASHDGLPDLTSPSPFTVEGTATVAMIDKIIREMATKDGQERIMSRLAGAFNDTSKDAQQVFTKIDQLADLVKTKLDHGQEASTMSSTAMVLSGDVDTAHMLSRIKDSVASNVALTAEIKFLLGELRVEILGMGHDLGRKLENMQHAPSSSTLGVEAVIKTSMTDLQAHLAQILEKHVASSSALSMTQPSRNSDETSDLMTLAVKENTDPRHTSLDRDEILTAVRAACQEFKPEIELQQFGLERDEILVVLKEGLDSYQATQSAQLPRISREEVIEALRAALQDLELPQSKIEIHAIRAEIFAAMRECLEEYRHTSAATLGSDASQSIIQSAVRKAIQEGPATTISRKDVCDAVKAGLDASTLADGSFGESLLHQLHALVDGMRDEYKDVANKESQQVLDAVRAASEMLIAQLESHLKQQGQDEASHVTVIVKAELAQLRQDIDARLISAAGPGIENLLPIIRTEFDSLQQNILQHITQKASADDETAEKAERGQTNHVMLLSGLNQVKSDLSSHKTEILETISRHMPSEITPFPTELLEAIRGEFENLKLSISTSLSAGSSRDAGELQDTIKLGLDDLRSHLDKKLDDPEDRLTRNTQLLDAFAEGLDPMRADIKAASSETKNSAFEVEILDTLRVGLAALHVQMESLSGRVGHDEKSIVTGTREIDEDERSSEPSSVDFEGLFSTLKLDIEALRADSNSTSHIDTHFEECKSLLTAIEAHVQETASVLATRKFAVKDDTDAIETLLRNTKAQLEEDATYYKDSAATKTHLTDVETITQSTLDVTQELLARLEDTSASKSDMQSLEALLLEARDALGEMSNSTINALTKVDIDALGILCTQIQTKLDTIEVPDLSSLASISDVEQIRGLLEDLRQSQEKFTDNYERDVGVTAQAFDQRKAELDLLGSQVATLHGILEATRRDPQQAESVQAAHFERISAALSELLSDTKDKSASTADLIAIIEAIKIEMQDYRAALDSVAGYDRQQLDFTEQQTETIVKAFTDELSNGVEQLKSKCEATQEAVNASAVVVQETVSANLAVLSQTKDTADELKVSVDTLGTMVSGSNLTMQETAHKLAQDLQIVVDRLEGLQASTKMSQESQTVEHQATREEIMKLDNAITDFRSQVTDDHPHVLSSLAALHALVAEHYAFSQKSTEGTLSSQSLELASRSLSESTPNGAETQRLDQISAQVMATAADVTALLTSQRALSTIADNTRKSAGLDFGQEHKDQLSHEIAELRKEKEAISDSLNDLRAEKTALAHDLSRLRADVNGLNVSLDIRCEELHAMNVRADALEKRVVEGLMNHSRAMLLTSTTVRPRPKQPRGRDLRDVSNDVSSTTSSIKKTSRISIMPAAPYDSADRLQLQSADGRRIMSLGQISGNAAADNRRALKASMPATSILPGIMKRSHSVKHSRAAPRKLSWTVVQQHPHRDMTVADKENEQVERLMEESESETDVLANYGPQTLPASPGRQPSLNSAVASMIVGAVRRQISDEVKADKHELTHRDPASDSGLGTDLPTAPTSIATLDS